MTVRGAGRAAWQALLAITAAAALTPAPAQALPLNTGLYRGSGHNGVEVAFSIITTPKGLAVAHVGAVCTNPDSDGLGRFWAENKDGDFSWLIGPDGRWGADRVFNGFNTVAAGSLDGTGGTLVLPNYRSLFEDCDPALVQSRVDNTTFQVSRVADLPPFTDGLYVARGGGFEGKDLELRVFGSGALIGDLRGEIGSAGLLCTTPLGRLVGGVIRDGGFFTLPWSVGDRNVSNPVTPADGSVFGTNATVNLTRDPASNGDCGVTRTTAQFALAKAKPLLAPLPPPAPLTNVPGGAPGAVPSTTCSDPALPNRVAAGPFVLCSAAAAAVDGRTATITGGATINGFLFADGGALEVDTRAFTISSRTPVSFGVVAGTTRITLGRTRLELDAKRLKGFSLPSPLRGLKLGRLPIDLSRVGGRAPELSIDLPNGALTISAGVQYPLLGSTLAATGEVTFGLAGWSGKLSASGFSVPLRVGDSQLFELKQFDLGYDQPTDTWTVAGKASVALPSAPEIEAEASGTFVAGRLRDIRVAATAGDEGAGRTRGLKGPYGTYFNSAGFSLGNLDGGLSNISAGVELGGGWPFKDVKVADVTFGGQGTLDLKALQLTLEAQAAVKALGQDIAGGDSKLAVDFRARSLTLETNVGIGDIITGRAHFVLDDGTFLSRDQLQLRFGPDSIPIRFIKDITPGWIPTPDAIGPLASAEALISNVGAGARTTYGTWKFKVGIAVLYKWGLNLPAVDVNLGTAKSLASLEPARGSRQARGPRTSGAFTVAPGQQGLIVSASGSADGRVVVRDPRGRVVIDTDGLTGQTQERSGGRVLVGRSGNEAGGAVLAPAPGRWSVTTSGGTPFTDVRTTLVPRPGTELARVTPLGGSRTLRPGSAVRVRVTGPAGGRVQLRAARSGRASDIGRRLATVRPGIRIVRVPRDWAGTSLRLVAVTEQGGVPVGSTRAARALRIVAARRGAPGRPVVVRGPSSTTVRFAKAAGAARYVVRLTVAGRRYEKVSRSPLVVLRVPTRGRTATVRVTPVGADGRYGPARTRVVR